MREITRCIHIALLCVQENIVDRPTMASVVLMLTSFSLTLMVPSEPAFFLHNSIDPEVPLLREERVTDSRASESNSIHVSTNEASMTELYPRQFLWYDYDCPVEHVYLSFWFFIFGLIYFNGVLDLGSRYHTGLYFSTTLFDVYLIPSSLGCNTLYSVTVVMHFIFAMYA